MYRNIRPVLVALVFVGSLVSPALFAQSKPSVASSPIEPRALDLLEAAGQSSTTRKRFLFALARLKEVRVEPGGCRLLRRFAVRSPAPRQGKGEGAGRASHGSLLRRCKAHGVSAHAERLLDRYPRSADSFRPAAARYSFCSAMCFRATPRRSRNPSRAHVTRVLPRSPETGATMQLSRPRAWNGSCGSTPAPRCRVALRVRCSMCKARRASRWISSTGS